MAETSSSDQPPTPVLSDQLCFALYATTNRVIRAYRPLLQPLGLTYVQYLVMLVLWEQSPASVGELGHQLNLDSGTLTPLLKRMEKSGLVLRERDPDDERRVLVSLTAHGCDMRAEAYRIWHEMMCQSGISAEESEELRERVNHLRESFE